MGDGVPGPELLIPRQFSAATHAGPLRDGRVLALAGTTMGTSWAVQFVSREPRDADAARTGIEALLLALNAQLSHWDPGSALGRYNRLPAGSWLAMPTDFAAVLDAAAQIAVTSDGALDPTLGALVNLWGYGPAGPRAPGAEPPSEHEIAGELASAGWPRLHRKDPLLRQPGGLQLDFSAIAKGHAVDRVADWLVRAGRVHHLVEIGGELRGQGVKPDGQPWWVALAPVADDPRPVRIALDGLSVATSGDAWRHHDRAGERLAHTLDPRTGRPLIDAPAAVTVLHPSCREADGWATALTVLGPEAGLRLADELGLAARWLMHGDVGPGRGRVIVSLAWLAMLETEAS